MTEIQRCEVRPGRLVEWVLHPTISDTETPTPYDERPPSYVQESHVRTARAVRDGGLFVPTWLGAAFDMPGRVDLDVLGEAFRIWTMRHETMRSGFRSEGGELRRFTMDADDFVLLRTDVGEFPEPLVLTRHLQDRFDVAADALSWPNFIYTAVVRDDGLSVYMAFDHSNVDAYSIYKIPSEIQELYAAGLDGQVVETDPIPSYIDFGTVERASADQIDEDHPVVDRWRSFVAKCDGKLPNFPLDLGLDPEGPLPTQRFLDEMLVGDAEAAEFEQQCRPYGGSLVGILAATGLIAQELTGQEVYRTVAPFHTRIQSQWSESVGWYVGGAPLEIPIAEARDFDAALELVRAELRRNRPMSRVPIARILTLLGADFRPTSPDLYSIVSFADSRGVPGSAPWQALKARGLIRVSYGDQVCLWITRVHEGLQFACRYPYTDTAYKSMRLYVDRLREMIITVGGQVPWNGSLSSEPSDTDRDFSVINPH